MTEENKNKRKKGKNKLVYDPTLKKIVVEGDKRTVLDITLDEANGF